MSHSFLEEDADGFYLYTVDYHLTGKNQPEMFFHPPETWKSVLTHLPDEFRECPQVEELWMGTRAKDEVQLWKRA